MVEEILVASGYQQFLIFFWKSFGSFFQSVIKVISHFVQQFLSDSFIGILREVTHFIVKTNTIDAPFLLRSDSSALVHPPLAYYFDIRTLWWCTSVFFCISCSTMSRLWKQLSVWFALFQWYTDMWRNNAMFGRIWRSRLWYVN